MIIHLNKPTQTDQQRINHLHPLYDIIYIDLNHIEQWNTSMQSREEYTHTLNEDGSITFFYRPSARLINKKAELDCPDLYEWMLDDNGKQKEFVESNQEIHEYSLRIDNIPSDIFSTYRVKVSDIVPIGSLETPHERIVSPHANQPIVVMNHLNLYTDGHRDLETKPASIIQEKTAYIKTGTAEIPPYFQSVSSEELAPSTLNGTVELRTFKSSDQIERDIWIYKSPKFDQIKPPEERKVIFMLDGKDFCEKLTPYIDANGEAFANTAIVFIDPGKYPAGRSILPPPDPPIAIPHRVYEDYYGTDKFSTMLGEELIPQYCRELGVSNKDNVIVAAHSLAAYPIITVAERCPNKIGGLFLFSPAFNQEKPRSLSTDPATEPSTILTNIPLFTQIGKSENATPPKRHQAEQDMQNKSRLKAAQDFQTTLGCNTNSRLRIHSSGHDAMHVFEGMVEGMKFHLSRLCANTTSRFKQLLNEQIRAAAKPVESVDETVKQAQANTPTPRPGSS